VRQHAGRIDGGVIVGPLMDVLFYLLTVIMVYRWARLSVFVHSQPTLGVCVMFAFCL